MTDSGIHVIITGGTIDSYYKGTEDTVVPHDHSIIPTYLESISLYKEFECTTICMKDSRGITQEDRRNIVDAVEHSKSKKILITHGTYTMPDTARYLQAQLTRSDQVIIVTGAMVPLQLLYSDGPFNIGFAVAELDHLKPGIYLAMNGRIFTPEEVAKNIAEGTFISIYNK